MNIVLFQFDLVADHYKLVLEDHRRLQLHVAIYESAATDAPVLAFYQSLFTARLAKLKTRNIRLSPEMGIKIKRYLNPHAQVRVRLLDDRGLVLDHARFAASELLNNERRLVLLDERTCSLTWRNGTVAEAAVIAEKSPVERLQAAMSKLLPDGRIRVTLHELRRLRRNATSELGIEKPICSVQIDEGLQTKQRARSDVIPTRELPQVARQFVFSDSHAADAADSAPLDSTLRIDVWRHGLLRDELQGRVIINLYDVRHTINMKLNQEENAVEEPAAGLGKVKSMGLLGAALKLSSRRNMTDQSHELDRENEELKKQRADEGEATYLQWHRLTGGKERNVALLVQVTICQMGPKSIRPERVAPNPPEKPNEEEKPEERAEDADGKDEFEMTPPPFIPNLAEMSEFARSFYNAGGVHADAEDELLRKEQEEKNAAEEKQAVEDKRRRAELHRAQRRLSASGALLLEEDEPPAEPAAAPVDAKKSKKKHHHKSRSRSRSHSRSRSRSASPDEKNAKNESDKKKSADESDEKKSADEKKNESSKLARVESLRVPASSPAPAPCSTPGAASELLLRVPSRGERLRASEPVTRAEAGLDDEEEDEDDFARIPELATSVASEASSLRTPPRSPLAESGILDELNDTWNVCAGCNEVPEEVDDAFTQDFCAHRVCRECILARAVLDQKSSRVGCPVEGCAGSTSNRVLRLLLPSDEFERRLEIELKETLANLGDSERIVSCPVEGCGFVCEAAEPAESRKSPRRHKHRKKGKEKMRSSKSKSARKDDDNDDNDDDDDDDDDESANDDDDPIHPSIATIERFRELHRFRCRKCDADFCDSCRKTPFHDGFTCESLKAWESAPKCRYCDERVAGGKEGDVCAEDECQMKKKYACAHSHSCGHACGGLKFEVDHLPCMVGECEAGAEQRSKAGVTQEADDFCNICWVEPLDAAPSLRLGCGHVYHLSCAKQRLAQRWGNTRINFAYLTCPLDDKAMDHPALARNVRQGVRLREQIERMALQRWQYEGLDKKSADMEAKDQIAAAMARFAYYECFKCKLPYFGGQVQCAGGPGEDEDGVFKAELLVCPSCAGGNKAVAGEGVRNCPTHGGDFIEYKCKFCCSIASWFCWGTTHMCDPCHKTQSAGYAGTKMSRRPTHHFPKHWVFDVDGCGNDEKTWPEHEKRHCPLGRHVKHPPNATQDWSLGCAVCKQEQQF